MSWLDQVLAVPTVGFVFKPWALSSNDYLAALRPLLTRWQQRGDAEVNIQMPNPLALDVRTPSGFVHSITSDKLVVQFRYSFELRSRPGQIPELRPNVQLDRYSVVLERTIDEACELADHILGSASRPLGRIGVVAECRLDGESLPPGVLAFIKHQERPWGKSLLKCQTHLLAVVTETDRHSDRCHHMLAMDEDNKNDVRLTLDWQRVIPSAIEIRSNKLRDQLGECAKSAVEYFEMFGKGELRYGEVD